MPEAIDLQEIWRKMRTTDLDFTMEPKFPKPQDRALTMTTVTWRQGMRETQKSEASNGREQ